VPCDENGSSVAKEEKPGDRAGPADDLCGDGRDHVAPDPESRRVLSVVPGRQSAGHTWLLVKDVARRPGGAPRALFTGDENPADAWALPEVQGKPVRPRRRGQRGRRPKPVKVPPKGLTCATAHKTRTNNRVVKAEARVVYGTKEGVKVAPAASKVSDGVSTAYVERHNGTGRNRKARKARKACGFAKDWDVHEALSYFTRPTDNFCWPVRAPRQKRGRRR
jgi:hypothetical protein